MHRHDIVVCIPKSKAAEIADEEQDVARREADGETDINYYWALGRLPKSEPKRIYFLWDAAVRSYHEVTGIDREAGRIYMATKETHIDPIPMKPFRGFRYLRGE